jgi:hypothetical protein
MTEKSGPNKTVLTIVVGAAVLFDLVIIALVVSGRMSGSIATPLVILAMLIAMGPILFKSLRPKG